MSAAEQQRLLKQAIQDRVFHPVYYLHGDDDFLKEEAVRRVVDAALDPATRDFNLEVRRGAELDAETLASLLATPPMMAERRVVVVRDVGALKKDARGALDRYLERPASDAVVLLVAAGDGKPDRKLLDRATAVEYGALGGDKVPRWIEQHARRELGGSITPPAADLLYQAVGADLPLLAAELDKLLSYTNGAEIDEAAVAAVVGVRRGETMGDLLDRIGRRDAAGALALLEHVLQQPKTNAVTIVMALATQTLALAWARARRDAGTPAGRLKGELFALLKESGSLYLGRPWGEAVDAWAQAVDRWTAEELDRALELLLQADLSLKESRLSSDEQLLATLILALCGPAARPRAAA